MNQEQKKIALFIGDDVTSHIVLNKIVPEILDQNYLPEIFLVSPPQPKENTPNSLKNLAFFERFIPNNVIYPFLEKKAYRNGHPVSPKQLAKIHSLNIATIDNVNNPNFVKSIFEDSRYTGGLNIRGFQKFGPEIIETIKGKGFFLNLHPGILPKYRGVMSVYRQLADKSDEAGWTLHHIDEDWDTGNIVDSKPCKVNTNSSGLDVTISMANSGSKAIIRAIQDYKEDRTLASYPQAEETAQYFTYPTSGEIQSWEEKGIKLYDSSSIPTTLTNIFIDASSQSHKELKKEIATAYQEWLSANDNTSKQICAQQNQP